MASPRIVSFRIPPERLSQLDSVAKSLERDRSHLLNEAVASYLDQQRRLVSLVNEGLRASKSGQTIGDEDLNALVASWINEKPTGKTKKARKRS